MKLSWYGHACFYLEAENGTTVVTDPYHPETSGYRPFTEAADIVVISSATDDFHNNAQLIPGEPLVINALELAQTGAPRSEKGTEFRAIEALEHKEHRGGNPDQNGMYRFEMDDLHIGHMGDMGNPLSQAQLDFFAGVDIFLALAGGYPTTALEDVKRAVESIQPRLVVPMHFRTLRYKPADSLWITSFLEYFNAVDFAASEQVTLHKRNLPEATRVLVLDYV